MVSSWRKRRNKRRGGNMPSFGSAPSSSSFGSAPSSPAPSSGFFGKLKAKASEMKTKADQMTGNMKNKLDNLKFKAEMKRQELSNRAQNAYGELKNKRFDPSIQTAADNFKAGVPKVGQKAKEIAVAATKIPGKLVEAATTFNEHKKAASQQKIAEGQAQQIMENRESMSIGGYRRKRRKSRKRKRHTRSKRKKSRRRKRRTRRKRKKFRRKKRRTRRR